MDKTGQSLYEKAVCRLMALAAEYKVPLTATWVAGLLAHMFVFTNKFVNHDEIMYLFGKGATFESGRWMLALTSYIFPDVSMPWIYGVISLGLISATVCFIVRIFNIRNKVLQGLLAGLMVTFPAQDSIFCFTFTCAPYALALFTSVLSVYIFICTQGNKRYFLSCAVLACALGIYQSYMALAASLYVILMIRALITGKSAKDVLCAGIVYVMMLLVSIGVYYAVTMLACKLTGTELLQYGYSENSIVFRALLAYSSFVRTLFSGYFGYVNDPASVIAHGVCSAAAAALVIIFLIRKKSLAETALTVLCIALLPLSIDSLYLIAQTGIISSWTQYPFVCIYILAVVIVDVLCADVRLRDIAMLAMTVIMISNIFFANKVYLKLFMDYENAYAFYTVLASDIKKSPDYRSDMKVYVAGEADDGVQPLHELKLGLFNGPADDLINVYTKGVFMNYYIGYDIPMIAFEEYHTRAELEASPEYSAMPAYPAEGSIAEINGYLVVKLG